MKELGLKDYDHYLDLLESRNSDEEKNCFIDSLSTNLTSFYRESHHFEHLSDYLVRSNINVDDLRIWSSACSTGQEAYNMAFILHKHYGANHQLNKPNILATDVNEKVLIKADSGIYNNKESSNVPSYYMSKRMDSPCKEIIKEVRNYILFKKLDLSKHPFKLSDQSFHIIFCRNVMIYFNHHLKQILLNEFSRLLKNDGILYLGHADTLGDLDHNFKMISPSIYRKR
jgi:chemotaxis protein methyltransferase CheR